jgi:hypothetical protein
MYARTLILQQNVADAEDQCLATVIHLSETAIR